MNKNLNLLVVEDDPIIRMDIVDILESNGYNVVSEASDGFMAIEMCKKHKPDLVLMDVDMPLLNGIKATKIIKKENLAGGVVILTALCSKKDIDNAKSVGALGYIIKPLDEKVAIPTIEMALSNAVEIKDLRTNLNKAINKINERKIIEKAKGIFVKQLNISEDEAYSKIRKLSMDRRTTMVDIANIIVVANED